MADVKKLSKLFVSAVEKTLDKKTAIAFSGGLDSSAIATVANGKCELELITVAFEGSEDLIAARLVANELGLKLHEVIVEREQLLEDYKKMWKLERGTLVDLELMCAIYEVCKKASSLGIKTVLFGSGAEELFIGYHKYYSAIDEGKELDEILPREIETLPQRDIRRAEMVAKLCGVEARVPFMDADFVDAVMEIPAMKRIGPIEMKKPLLREIARELGVPTLAVGRQKKAMQYGANIHKTFMDMVRKKEIETQEPRPPFVYD